MNKINPKMSLLAVCFICLLVAGCSDNQETIELKRKDNIARKACVDSGGVPIQSWFNNNVLGDCKYPPATRN